MERLLTNDALCPWCGAALELLIDASAGDCEYIEDCHVCCSPILTRVRFDPLDSQCCSVTLVRDNE